MSSSALVKKGKLPVPPPPASPRPPPRPEPGVVIVGPPPARPGQLVAAGRPVHEIALADGQRGLAGADGEVRLLGRTGGALGEAEVRAHHEKRRVARAAGIER